MMDSLSSTDMMYTLVFSDKSKSMSFKTSTCNPDNPMRKNMEHIVGEVGLDSFNRLELWTKGETAMNLNLDLKQKWYLLTQ